MIRSNRKAESYIHSGLDIGSKSPAEIAISIMAEITKALHAT